MKPFPLLTHNDSSSFLSSLSSKPAAIFLAVVVLLLHLATTIVLGSIEYRGNGNETDRVALLAIKDGLVDNPGGILSSWNHTLHHCEWEGVTCGHRHRRVTLLDLHSRRLGGTISPFIGNLSFLTSLSLANNSLHGQIPHEVGRLLRLRELALANNTLDGEIPANLSHCLNLQYLYLGKNQLEGHLKMGIGGLTKLKRLQIGQNHFIGPLFEEIENLTSLQEIAGEYNGFTGTIPDSITRMRNLTYLQVAENELSGTIPSSIFNLSNLEQLELSENHLQGSLSPITLAHNLPRLTWLNLGNNFLSGPLPMSITNLTSLSLLELSDNNFTNVMMPNFGLLNNLGVLLLAHNKLHSSINFVSQLVNCTNLQELGLTGNSFPGALPQSVANLSAHLYYLALGETQIDGRIPAGIGNLNNLIFLYMNNNQLIGNIPSDLGKLHNIQRMVFEENKLTGTIPNFYGNLSYLTYHSLNSNHLQGSIPPSLGSCQNMIGLDLSNNHLSGTLPNELFAGSTNFVYLYLSQNQLKGSLPSNIGKQVHLQELDVSHNKLTGQIPTGIAACADLERLLMKNNLFYGSIPSSFTSLRSLLEIDLSYNNLSGPIPDYFSKFPLVYLNLSYNNFEGKVPTNGVFANASAISLVGNVKLCGGIPQLNLSGCVVKERKKKRISHALKLIIPIISGLVGVAMVMWFYTIFYKKKQGSTSSDSLTREAFLKVSYNMLLKATDGFSSENLLGRGTFGSVFKGTMEPDGNIVAVKVLNLQNQGASKSFIAECKAMRNIRHRNLVKMITACSTIDFQGNDFKALVYEFMPNGSLDKWLHEIRNLSLVQRIDIAIDVAFALDYLHQGGELPLVHCDLKPSNVLLDDDMVAHVGDFGLARFLTQHQNPHQSSSIGIRGTIGYAAPEYGLGSEASKEGDIYSYGILLLELMTRKRPTDNMIKEDFNLHMYAKATLPDQVLQIVDPILIEQESKEANERRHTQAMLQARFECLISVVEVGVACSNQSPQDRMRITDALKKLQSAKEILTNARNTCIQYPQ